MINTEKYNVRLLKINENYAINGGEVEPAEGSYSFGYEIGSAIRSFFRSIGENYYRGSTHIWGG